MTPKRSAASPVTSGAARYGSNTATGRRKRISISKINLDQPLPTQARNRRPSTTESSAQTRLDGPSDNQYSAPISSARARARSRSRSSSSTCSSTGDSDDQSPSPPAIATAPSLMRFSTASATNRSTTSLLSSRNKSYTSLPRSLSSAHLVNFAPPFYNRPPTPLPPSPSLTSLLRPTFSATPSRPTTPDESETEQQTQSTTQTPSIAGLSTTTTGTADTNQKHLLDTARTAQPLPRASPKVPTYEYYGFVLYLTSSLFFLGYVLWSYLPSPFLHRLGIYYYPDRWWSLAIPAWIVMAVGFVYVGLAGYNVEVLTLPLSSLGAVVDEVGVVAVIDERTGRLKSQRASGSREREGDERRGTWDWKDCWNEGTDAVLDVPIGGVCEVLYGHT